jgi:hypothetical protein
VETTFFFLGQGGNVGDDAAEDSQKCCLVGSESGARVPINLGLHHPELIWMRSLASWCGVVCQFGTESIA